MKDLVYIAASCPAGGVKLLRITGPAANHLKIGDPVPLKKEEGWFVREILEPKFYKKFEFLRSAREKSSAVPEVVSAMFKLGRHSYVSDW